MSGLAIKGYQLSERIGAGGFGAVYTAEQSTVGRRVAVKIILPGYANQPDFIRRFESEARLVARLEHPYIVPLYDYWRDPSGAYLVMRWLRGGSLRDALGERPFALPMAAQILDQVASGLSLAHRSGVVHRDIKPSNILLDEEGNAYLSDFGIAQEVKRAEKDGRGERLVGTLDYLSPEQAKDEVTGPQSDIYSLGITLYELLTGQHPYPGHSSVERLFKHINDPLPEIEELGEGVNEVLQKATAKNPGQRYADALEMAAAFRQAARLDEDGQGVSLVETLTPREQQILGLIVAGKANRQIAQELFIELSTVKWYIRQIYSKLGARSRVQAMVRARELQLVVPGPEDVKQAPRITSVSLTLQEVANPYKGLKAFEAADSRDFFGREALIKRLVDRLNGAEEQAGPRGRFLAIVGPSGSGKSSLVQAGLIPTIWRGALPGSERWFVVEMMPGSRPLDELEVALTRVAANQVERLHEQLTRDENGLLRVAGLILPNDGSELVLIIDQLEELFTLVENEEERQFFLNLLRQAVSDPRSRVRVVTTLRADFYHRPLQYPEFGELVRGQMETVLPLSAEELERAIVRPAEGAGAQFEAGLTPTIIEDVRYQPGGLPLMQYALTELFDRREGRLLTRGAYERIGGIAGALAGRAESLYQELDPEGQEMVRQLFLQLTTVDQDTDDGLLQPLTRRRVTHSELQAVAGDPEMMDEVIDTFAAYRLLALDNDPATRRPTVEVAHEAILVSWDRLRSWLEESREDLRQRRRLQRLVADWQEAGRDPSFLLAGTQLDLFVNWAAATDLALMTEEKEFLAANVTAREARLAKEEARQQRELETAQQLAEAEKRRAEEQAQAAEHLRSLAYLLAGALLIAAVLAAAALGFARASSRNANTAATRAAEALANQYLAATNEAQALANEARAEENAALAATREAEAEASAGLAATRQVLAEEEAGQRATAEALAVEEREAAEQQARLATSRELAAAALNNLDADPELSILLAKYALETVHTMEAESALHQAVQNSRTRQTFNGEGLYPMVWVTADLTGRRIFTSGPGDGVMWDVGSGEMLFTYSLTSEYDEVWINRSAFSPDGSYLVMPLEEWQDDEMLEGRIVILDAQSGEEILAIPASAGGVQAVTFNLAGTHFVTAPLTGGAATVWDLAAILEGGSGQTVATLCCHAADIVWAAHFSPDGALIITVGDDDTIRVWDAVSGEEQLVIDNIEPSDAVFTPDGQYIAVGDDREVLLFDAQSGERQDAVPNPGQNFVVLSFSPEGSRLAASNFDGKIRIWDYADGELAPDPLVLAGHKALAGGISFLPDGNFLASGSVDGTARVWDISPTGSSEYGQYAHDSRAFDVDFSPDGSWLVSTGLDGTARIWDTAAREEQFVLEHPSWVIEADIHPDGRTLATSSSDGKIHIWDAKTGEELRTIEAHAVDQEQVFEGVKGIAYSPDGDLLASGGADTTVRVWDAASGEQLLELNGHDAPVHSVEFTADGRRLVSAGHDGTLRVWDLGKGQELWTLTGDPSTIWFMTFSVDGSYLAVSHENSQVIIWSFPDPEFDPDARPEIAWQIENVPLAGNPGFSPDGSLLAVPNRDGLTLYDTRTGEVVLNQEGGATTTTFSPDGRMIAAAGFDGIVRIIAADLDSLVELAETRVTRGFTVEECERFNLEICPWDPVTSK